MKIFPSVFIVKMLVLLSLSGSLLGAELALKGPLETQEAPVLYSPADRFDAADRKPSLPLAYYTLKSGDGRVLRPNVPTVFVLSKNKQTVFAMEYANFYVVRGNEALSFFLLPGFLEWTRSLLLFENQGDAKKNSEEFAKVGAPAVEKSSIERHRLMISPDLPKTFYIEGKLHSSIMIPQITKLEVVGDVLKLSIEIPNLNRHATFWIDLREVKVVKTNSDFKEELSSDETGE